MSCSHTQKKAVIDMLDKSMAYIGILMTNENTREYPRYDLLEGFTFDFYRKGYEEAWAKIQFDLEQTDSVDSAKQLFEDEFAIGCENLEKQYVFVLNGEKKVVSYGSVWSGEHFGEGFYRLHWIATAAEYQGRGIAKALLTKLLDVYNEIDNKNFIYLVSQTWSYKAINLYQKFGFTPYLGEKPISWKGSAEEFDVKNKEAWDMINRKITLHNNIITLH